MPVLEDDQCGNRNPAQHPEPIAVKQPEDHRQRSHTNPGPGIGIPQQQGGQGHDQKHDPRGRRRKNPVSYTHLDVYKRQKREYDKLAEALYQVSETGYGIVPPALEEMALEEPEIIRQGGRFGVRLRASAPSLHIVRVDVNSEIAPVVGSERQSEELVNYLLEEFEENPEKLWESQIFGKSRCV